MKRFLFLIATVAMLAMNATANVTFNVGELRFWVCDDGKSVFLQKGGNISGAIMLDGKRISERGKGVINPDAMYSETNRAD